MKHFVRALTLASALFVAGPVQAQELLRWGFQDGDTWEYRMTQNVSTRVDPLRSPETGQLSGQSMQQSQIQTVTLEAAVQQVDADGNITVDWTYTRIQMSAELAETSLEWDSDRPDSTLAGTPQASMIAPLQAMLGRTLTVVMTPRGEILEWSGGEAMLAAMLEGMDPAMSLMMEEQLGPMFDGEQMASQFMGGATTFPESPMAVGDSWTARSEVPLPMLGNMVSEIRNTVTEFGNQSGERVVLIVHEGTMELDAPELGPDLPMTITLNEGSQSGSTTFSLDRGLILSTTNTTEQAMTSSMPAMGIRMQTRTEGSIVLELVGPVTGPPRE